MPGAVVPSLEGLQITPQGPAVEAQSLADLAGVGKTPSAEDELAVEEIAPMSLPMGGGGFGPEGDPPPPPVVTVTAVDPTAAELNPPAGETDDFSTGVFRLTRDGDWRVPLTVSYTVSGTATPGDDYQALTGTATFEAEQTEIAIHVQPVNDGVVEPDESVTLTLTEPAGGEYQLGEPSTDTVTVVSNDAQVVQMRPVDKVAAEPGSDNGTFRIERSISAGSLAVNFYADGGSAVPGDDFVVQGAVPQPDGTFVANLPAGTASIDVTVVPLDDTFVEPTESAYLGLEGGDYQLGMYSGGAVDVRDDDTVPPPPPGPPIDDGYTRIKMVGVAAIDPTASEFGPGTGEFHISRNHTAGDLVVKFALTGGTNYPALYGIDYEALTYYDPVTGVGEVTIPDGSTGVGLRIDPIPDGLVETPEGVTLQIQASAAYQIVAASALITIADDVRSADVEQGGGREQPGGPKPPDGV